MTIKRIGVLTGGGDAPGLNAVIRAVTKSAICQHGWEVMGIEDGFDGLILPDKVQPLTLESVRGILPRGGTILGTTNRGNPFAFGVKVGDKIEVRDVSDELIARCRELALDCLVVIGGDGSLHIALELFEKGLRVVGVPKTIDNDIGATERCFGFPDGRADRHRGAGQAAHDGREPSPGDAAGGDGAGGGLDRPGERAGRRGRRHPDPGDPVQDVVHHRDDPPAGAVGAQVQHHRGVGGREDRGRAPRCTRTRASRAAGCRGWAGSACWWRRRSSGRPARRRG